MIINGFFLNFNLQWVTELADSGTPSLYPDSSVPTGPEFRYLDIVRYTILRLETSGSSFMQEGTG